MLERDQARKLELDLVNSLHGDMTLRLTMHQRTIKQLGEKVLALEAAEVAARQKHEADLHQKVTVRSSYPSQALQTSYPLQALQIKYCCV